MIFLKKEIGGFREPILFQNLIELAKRERVAKRYSAKFRCGFVSRGDYKDLFVYFDNADKSSPINEPATKAFKCYGLDGNQTTINWTAVRGTCVVGRAEPPAISSFTSPFSSQQTSFSYEPLLPEELVETLMYFKDKNTREVALERDALRTTGYIPQQVFPGSSHYAYPGGSAVPYSWMVAKCGHCGKSKAQADLKRCPCHQITYCNQQCQKADWSKHKLTCSARKQPQGTASSSTSTTAKASSK